MALLHMEPPVIMNLKKIRRLMDKFNLSFPIRKANPYRRMAKALKTSNAAENLLQREFECCGPRMVLLTDITYLPYNGTFAYLSSILDDFYQRNDYPQRPRMSLHQLQLHQHSVGQETSPVHVTAGQLPEQRSARELPWSYEGAYQREAQDLYRIFTPSSFNNCCIAVPPFPKV